MLLMDFTSLASLLVILENVTKDLEFPINIERSFEVIYLMCNLCAKAFSCQNIGFLMPPGVHLLLAAAELLPEVALLYSVLAANTLRTKQHQKNKEQTVEH